MSQDLEKLRQQFEAAMPVPQNVIFRGGGYTLPFGFALGPLDVTGHLYNAKWQGYQLAVPEGCVVVPVEPTFEMLRDGRCFADNARDVFISMCLAASKEEAAKGEK